jgi:hypothetical protein
MRVGSHQIMFKATDKAGNEDVQTVVFDVN